MDRTTMEIVVQHTHPKIWRVLWIQWERIKPCLKMCHQKQQTLKALNFGWIMLILQTACCENMNVVSLKAHYIFHKCVRFVIKYCFTRASSQVKNWLLHTFHPVVTWLAEVFSNVLCKINWHREKQNILSMSTTHSLIYASNVSLQELRLWSRGHAYSRLQP